jgi:DNA-binding response OmpR family regulator
VGRVNTSKDGKQLVLLIEDQQGMANFLALKLKMSGYGVVSSSDAGNGLELAQKINSDIILLDETMTGTGGIEVLRSLRKFSNVPVIVLSARDHMNEESMSIGTTAFVSKPFNVNELIAKIKTMLQPGFTK